MGHTGPRTNCAVLRYHIGRFNELFTLEGGVWVYHSERVDAKMTADLGDMLGGMNSSDQAQWGVGTPYPPNPNAPNPGGGGPTPPGTPADAWPVQMQPPMWGGERRSGDNGVPYANPRAITCVPITIPAGTTGQLKMSVAEYRSPATFKQACLTLVPGDFAHALAFSQGNTAEPAIDAGAYAGQTLYFCWRYWSPDLNAPSCGEEPQGVSYGGGWPA